MSQTSGGEVKPVDGKMIWFNEVKDFGFIRTAEGERIYVDRSGFLPGKAPVGRCAGLAVKLNVTEHNGKRVATEVTIVPDGDQRRARRRGPGGGLR